MVTTRVYKARSGQNKVKNKRWSCSLSPSLSTQLNAEKDDHIRIEHSGEPCYCRVREIHEKEKYPLRIPERTREKSGIDHHADVTVSKVVPQESYMEARRLSGLAETVWDDSRQQEVLVYAPHGGDIEFGTDDAAIRLYNKLDRNGYDCSLWALHGFGENSFNRWHASKPGLSSGSYPGLDQISDREYDLVISFHVQSKNYTAVGGRIDDSIRRRIADEMDERIRDRYEFRWRHENMRWKGVSDSNLVNSLCKDPGGIQIEMQPIIGYKYRKRVVNSVFSVIEEEF